MHMKVVRRAFCLMLLALCLSAQAQPATKIPRLGYLLPGAPANESNRLAAIRLALREHGYVEGQNIAIEHRYAEEKSERYAELAAELVRLKVDIILVAGGDAIVRAAMNATKTIPIVMIGLPSDPVEAGIVDSLARPGGNVTGLSLLVRELGGKRLELLKEAVPKLASVAVFYNPTSPISVRDVKEILPTAARALKLTIQPWGVRGSEDFDRIFAAMSKQRTDGLYAPSDLLWRTNQKRIVNFTLESRLPSIYVNHPFVEAGGLMSYGADLTDSYKRVAYYVDRILKGTKPADLPVEQPTKFEFVISLKTANQIGVKVAPEVLARATRIIK